MQEPPETPPRGRHPLPRLLEHLGGRRRTVLWASVCSVLNKVLDLAPPVLIGLAVDVVVERETSLLARLGVESPGAQLALLCAATALIFALESLFEWLYALAWRNLAQAVQHDLRGAAWEHVLRLDLGWHEDRSTGRLLNVLVDDVNQLERFLDGGANELLQVATTVLVIGGVFVWIAPQVAVLAMAPIPPILVASLAYQRRLAPRYARVREEAGRLAGLFAQSLQGIAVIHAFTAERHEADRARAASGAYREANRGAIALSAAYTPLIRMAVLVAFLAALGVGGALTLDGRLSVGTYSLLVFLVQRMVWPVTRLGGTFDLYQRAMASTARILDLLDAAPAVQGGGRALAPGEVRGHLRFEGVTFAYPGRAPVLDGLDLDVPAGATVAVVGATGAGKTTLVKLLLRFHDPQGGRITLDGVDLRDLDPASLRGAVGLVGQDPFLFDGTVRENVRYGTFDADDAALEAACRAAEAHDFVAALPRGYDTVVGERGQKLSGGQRQRISIARAVLKDPPVLVLDEATSSVDNETEAAIQRSLARITRDRTTLVIAHRLSTIRHADRIVVLEAGRPLEQGTHEALLARDGAYAALWRVQTGELAPGA